MCGGKYGKDSMTYLQNFSNERNERIGKLILTFVFLIFFPLVSQAQIQFQNHKQPVPNADIWKTPTLKDRFFIATTSVEEFLDMSQMPVAAEWGYSFYHLKDGALDGAGRVHHGGYPSPPKDRAEALEVMKNYVLKTYVGDPDQPHPWCSMNGHYPYHHYAAQWGFDILCSEIGENINSYQMMIAFNRGAARQYHKPWCIDFSVWHGPGLTDYWPKKLWGDYSHPDYGHSVSLYRRAAFMVYMAGANAWIAEAGVVNLFLHEYPPEKQKLAIRYFEHDDHDAFTLSPLGEVLQELSDFSRAYPDIGIPYTPIGIVLDRYHGCYGGIEGPHPKAFGEFDYTPGDWMTWKLLDMFFPGGWVVSKEVGTLVAGPYGDVCDVLLQDASDEVLASYPILILSGDIGFDDEFTKKMIGYVENGGTLLLNSAYCEYFTGGTEWNDRTGVTVRKVPMGKGVISFYGPDHDIQVCKTVIPQLLETLIPFEVRGKVQYLWNWKPPGWVLTVINNEGITKTFHEKPIIDPAKKQDVVVHYRGNERVVKCRSLLPETDLSFSDDKTIRFELPPGEIRIIKFLFDESSLF